MILIFSNRFDEHTYVITEKLKRHNAKVQVIDIGNLTKYMSVEVNYNFENTKFSIYNGTRNIDLDTITSIWWRRPTLPSINREIFNLQYVNFAYNEWVTILNGIWQCNRDKLWINDLTHDANASNKIYQLDIAKKVGLPIPRTLVSNDPSSTLSFWKENHGKIIFKSFLATYQQWRETRPLRVEFLKYIHTLKYVPCIFQEYINKSYDIRVVVIGNKLFAGRTKASNLYEFDWRMTQPNFKEHILTEEIRELILKFMQELKLEFGAIDMKLTEDGRYFFLEINPAGQFLFLEYDTKMTISNTLATHLLSGKKTRN